jgi:hypothetical protein
MKVFKFACLFLIMVAAISVNAQSVSWTKFNSVAGRYQVKFPAAPESETNESNQATTYKTSVTLGEMYYLVSASVHSQPLTGRKELTQKAANSFVTSLDGKKVRESVWKYKNHEGLYVLIEIPHKKARVEYYTIMIDNVQYQLVAVADIQYYDQKIAKKFFKSFKAKY